MEKVVLAYSGGLDTSVILHWLQQEYKAQVRAVLVDVGQGEELEEAAERATRLGSQDVVIIDARETLIEDYFFPMLRAGALYENYYLLGTSVARPTIAKALVDAARDFGADTIVHGATGKGNDQVRFELSVASLAPELKTFAPWRHWDFKGREDCIAYAKAHNLPLTVTKERPYSSDANLLHISYEGGVLEDPWLPPPADMWQRTRGLDDCLSYGETIEIDFESGIPVAVQGEQLDGVSLLELLNAMGGRHGVGRIDIVENRFVGIKSRGCYESPGPEVLRHAFNAVSSLTVDREASRVLDTLKSRYTDAVYNGYWFSPEREALQASVDYITKSITGTARLRLERGTVQIVGRKSPCSLYDQNLVSFEEDGGYTQSDAGGFINILGHRLRLASLRECSDE